MGNSLLGKNQEITFWLSFAPGYPTDHSAAGLIYWPKENKKVENVGKFIIWYSAKFNDNIREALSNDSKAVFFTLKAYPKVKDCML